MIVLLTLCLVIAAVCIVWLAIYSQKRIPREIEFSIAHQELHPSTEKTGSESKSGSVLTQKIVRSHTTKGSAVKHVNVFRSKTTFNTFDILDEVGGVENALKKGEQSTSGDDKTKVEEERAYQPKKLKVIVVPHSHNDPGWIRTIDSYFEAQTKLILNNMVEKLLIYPKMTFIWAETVFLSMWWKDLDKTSREAVRKLIDRRQLEIVSGGWILTDEANCHYSAIIDQMIEGHHWLRENIGCVPKTSWSLDPFGYSSLHPYLYKKVGYDNAVILRVSDNIKHSLQRRKGLEFYWRQVWDRNNETDIFTLMMPYMLYNIKHSCGPDKEICLMFDFRQIPGEVSESRAVPIDSGNIDRQAKLLLTQYQKKANLFRHGVVLIPLGDDFRYDRSVEWDQQYKNYQKLFNYINAQDNWKVHVRFGIVQDYFDEVAKVVVESGKSHREFFPSLSGDFFPYTDHDDEYWTGYFTSRPFRKLLSRELEVYLRAAEILNTHCVRRNAETGGQLYNAKDMLDHLDVARKNLALFQHHDAIAGTSTVWVVEDYESRLYQGLSLVNSVIGSVLSSLLSSTVKSVTPIAVRVLDPLYSRTLTTVQIIRLNDDRVKIVIFNPVTRERQELVQLLVDQEELEITDNRGRSVTSQVTKDHKVTRNQYTLSFLAELPALGIVTYDLVKTVSPKHRHVSTITEFKSFNHTNDVIVMENEILSVNISASRGQLVALGLKSDGTRLRSHIRFLFYSSRRSGAYIFAPNVPASEKNFSRPQSITSVRGPVFSEVRVKYSCVTHILRLVNSSEPIGRALEVDNIVDLSSSDYDDLELVMRLDSSLKSKDIFYTDQNGYHIMKRRRRPNMLLEANYYPSSSVVYIEDDAHRLSVITAQPLGVSSLKQGSIELMLDRRLKYDDGRGLGSGVMDNKVVLGRFYVLPEKIVDDSARSQEPYAAQSLLANILIDSLRNYPILAATNYRDNLPAVSLMNAPMPCDVLLVNLRMLGNSSNRAAMILHRQATSTKFRTTNVELKCNKMETRRIVIPQLFHSLQLQRVYESSLSFLHRKHEIPLEQPLNLETLELYAYEIIFDKNR